MPAQKDHPHVKAVTAAENHSLWLGDDGVLWAVGNNQHGQLGNGALANIIPESVATGVKIASTGHRHTLYITDDNQLWAMGDNSSGQLANGTLASTAAPTPVAANIAEVSAGGSHTLFIATGDIRIDPPPPPVITSFTPATITAQTKVIITGSNFNNCAGVYFGTVPADQYTVDSPTQITAYAPVVATGDNGHVYVGTFDGVATSDTTYSASYPPMLGDRIENQIVRFGDSASIFPPVLGAPNPVITWEISTDNGATWNTLLADAHHGIDASGILKITGTPLSLDGNRYRFTATNIHGAITSAAFTLTVVFQPVVMAHPLSQTITAGTPATFTADIEGAPAPALQWQISTNNALTWSNITGATTATHTIAATNTAMNGNQYRCIATNTEGTATTNPATLTVQWAPLQNNPIASQAAAIGNTVVFSADIDANPAPNSYQWQLSTDDGATWENLANAPGVTGATGAKLQIAATTTAMDGNQYRCIVTNGIGSITTQSVTLHITNSPFATPSGLFLASGTLYVSDADTHTVYLVELDINKATPIAGAIGVPGTTNSTTGTNARFNSPAGIALTQDDKTIYIADAGNNAIRSIAPTGAVSTLFATNDFGNATGITVTRADTLFLAQPRNHVITRIYYTGSAYVLDTVSGIPDTPGSQTGFRPTYREPSALAAVPGADRIAIADTGNHTIRVLNYSPFYGERGSFDSSSTTLRGGAAGQPGSLDGFRDAARFNSPAGVAAASTAIYVADTGNHIIRRIDSLDNVTTIAGMPGSAGFADGTGTNARFNTPTALAIDSSYANLYIADSANSVIRKLNLATREVTTLAISATGTPPPPPVILIHPRSIDATQHIDGPLVLTFTATGRGPLTSQWQKDGSDITASSRLVIDANSLSIYNYTTADSGQYRVIVSNSGGSTPSYPAIVTVTAGTTKKPDFDDSGANSGGGGGGGAVSPWWLAAVAALLALRGVRRR